MIFSRGTACHGVCRLGGGARHRLCGGRHARAAQSTREGLVPRAPSLRPGEAFVSGHNFWDFWPPVDRAARRVLDCARHADQADNLENDHGQRGGGRGVGQRGCLPDGARPGLRMRSRSRRLRADVPCVRGRAVVAAPVLFRRDGWEAVPLRRPLRPVRARRGAVRRVPDGAGRGGRLSPCGADARRCVGALRPRRPARRCGR